MADGEEARNRMQIKSFTTWVNLHLQKVGLEVENLFKDFQDGIKLLKLVEVISEEELGRYHKKPVGKFQKVENINIPLAVINGFLKEQKITNQYSAENILEENEVLILGMIWSLILRYAVQEVSEGDRTAKEGLLLWAQKKVEEGSGGKTKVTNFHTSWQDGTAFCSLIRAYRPDLIDASQMRAATNPDGKATNLNLAFQVASEHLNIPAMLDANDMMSHKPDEKSVMTYISFFWKEFASTKRKQLAAAAIGQVVAREIQVAEIEAQYLELASGLSTWMQETIARHSQRSEDGAAASDDLQTALDKYVEYGREDKPRRIHQVGRTAGRGRGRGA